MDVTVALKKVPSTITPSTTQSQRMSTRTRQLTRIAPMTPPRSPKSLTHLTLRLNLRVLLKWRLLLPSNLYQWRSKQTNEFSNCIRTVSLTLKTVVNNWITPCFSLAMEKPRMGRSSGSWGTHGELLGGKTAICAWLSLKRTALASVEFNSLAYTLISELSQTFSLGLKRTSCDI